VGDPLHVPVEAVKVVATTGEPEIVGSNVLFGTAGAVTTAVGADAATAEPPEFEAVTRTRSVKPTSPTVAVYVLPVAPASAAHVAPAGSQRLH
jgi:hypothetical protein